MRRRVQHIVETSKGTIGTYCTRHHQKRTDDIRNGTDIHCCSRNDTAFHRLPGMEGAVTLLFRIRFQPNGQTNYRMPLPANESGLHCLSDNGLI